MNIEVCAVGRVTDEIAEAVARLMPQLSPALQAPPTERLHAIAACDRTVLFVARAAGVPVGMLTLAWYDAPSGRKAWVEDVAVDAAMRGRGIGGALVRAALTHAAQIGAGRVMLTSNPTREAARALYRRMGFEEAGTTLFVRKTDKE